MGFDSRRVEDEFEERRQKMVADLAAPPPETRNKGGKGRGRRAALVMRALRHGSRGGAATNGYGRWRWIRVRVSEFI